MIKNIAKNITEIHVNDLILLLSYDTPVAWCDSKRYTIYITKKKWSATTTRHINQFIGNTWSFNKFIEKVGQDEMDLLYKNILNGNSLTNLNIKQNRKDRFDDLII